MAINCAIVEPADHKTVKAESSGIEPTPLGGEAAFLLLTNLAQAAGPYGALLILSHRFGLEAAGLFAYFQAIILPFFQFLSFQLKPLLLTHRRSEISLERAESVRLLTSVAGLGVAAAVYVGFGGLACALALAKLLEGWSDLYQAEFQRAGQAWKAFAASVVRSALLYLILLVASNATWAFGIHALLSCGILWFWEAKAPRRLHTGEEPSRPLSGILLLRRGAGLGVVLLLSALQASLPRVALQMWTSSLALGLFATIGVLLQSGNLLASAYGQSLLPRMKDSTLRELGIILLRPAAVGAALVGPLWFGESWMLALMGVANSREAIETFRALTWVQILVWPAAAAGCALTAKRLYRPQLFITALLTVVSAIGSASLVPAYGSVGAAAVLGLNATTMLALSYLVLWQASAGAALGSRQERAPA